MNPHRIIIPILCFILCGHTLARAQDIDTELSNLTERLAAKIGPKDVKKVAVIDFNDLLGGSSELGKYIAEQMTVDFVMTNRSFSVLDRANLNRILAEHKLTAKGLIDPDNCKKLGMFAGVDAIILGTIIPKGENIVLTAKIITTETAEIVGADKAGFKTDDNVKQLMSQAATGGSSTSGGSSDDSTKVSKTLGNMSVNLQSLQIINGGKNFLLTFSVANLSTKKSLWVALSPGKYGIVRDSNGFEFLMSGDGSAGIVSAAVTRYMSVLSGTVLPPDHFYQATEIKPGETVSATAKFYSDENRIASAGDCSVQLEFLSGNDFNNGSGGNCTAKSFTAKLPAE
jgi:curli biogenesis system outer membrane secretion channel CsgG